MPLTVKLFNHSFHDWGYTPDLYGSYIPFVTVSSE